MVSTGTTKVLKHIKFAHDEPEHRQRVEKEIQLMRQLSGHANIVALDDAEIGDGQALLLMEQCHGDILGLINNHLPRHLDEKTILHIFGDACKAVAHMHYQRPPVLHRDLKVENILIGDSNYKLCDFGSATDQLVQPDRRVARDQVVALEEEIQRYTTLEYRAPEMIDLYLQRGITEKADIWALGVLLYKLCYYCTPFDNASPLAILNAEYSIPERPSYSKQLKHIFQITMREEPRERCTIYTLCAYVCGLRGEQCMLEDIYASPPSSPAGTPMMHSISNNSSRSGTPAQHQPKRYAAKQTPAAASFADQSAITELDSDAIVPMRRGRPTKKPDATGAAVSALPNAKSAGFDAATPPPKTARLYSASKVGFKSKMDYVSPYPSHMSMSQPTTPINHQETTSGLGIYSKTERASGPGKESRDTLPVSAHTTLDGLESLSMDFVEGAVFGSTRRTSMVRRKPSQRTSVASSPASAFSDVATPMSADNVRGTPHAEAVAQSGQPPILPNFVHQPLPPPPQSAGSGLVANNLQAHGAQTVQLASPPVSRKSLGAPDDAIASPLSMDTLLRQGQQQLQTMPSDAQFSVSPSSNLDDAFDTSHNGWDVRQSIGAQSNNSLRLSTILEAYQDMDLGESDMSKSAVPQSKARIKSIYDMTWDKLEGDSSRYSTLFDDQLFNAKAQYAKQRTSVYQNPENYYKSTKPSEEAQNSWKSMPASTLDDMLSRMEEYNKQLTPTTPAAKSDLWATQPPTQPPPALAAVPEEADVLPVDRQLDAQLDIDELVRRAGDRNRKKLVAQNNRRSMYISNNAALAATTELLPEDVDDGMRVLSDNEMEDLLKKMDMYNRELLNEQEKWQAPSEAGMGGEVDLTKIDQVLEMTNDRLLREEQQNAIRQSEPQAAKPKASGLFDKVKSVAMAKFAKPAVSPVLSAAAAEHGSTPVGHTPASADSLPAADPVAASELPAVAAAPLKPPRTFAHTTATTPPAESAAAAVVADESNVVEGEVEVESAPKVEAEPEAPKIQAIPE
ncbi:Ark- serine/threonine protein kinase, partial [Linderina pennispora]